MLDAGMLDAGAGKTKSRSGKLAPTGEFSFSSDPARGSLRISRFARERSRRIICVRRADWRTRIEARLTRICVRTYVSQFESLGERLGELTR